MISFKIISLFSSISLQVNAASPPPNMRWSRLPDCTSWVNDFQELADGSAWFLASSLRDIQDQPETARSPTIFNIDPATGDTLKTAFFCPWILFATSNASVSIKLWG
jgi:hypothetical protein